MDFDRRLSEGPLRVSSLWSQEQTERLPQQMLARRRRQAITRGAAALSVVATLAAGVWLWSPQLSPPSLGAPLASSSATPNFPADPREFALTDGSRVSLLGAGSRVDVLQQTPVLVRTQLSVGSARFDVRHDAARVFEVESGDVKVRVLGTAFSVAREGAFTRVSVERGAVRVQWTGGETVLAAGQFGSYPPVIAPRGSAEPLGELAGGVAEEATSWRKLAGRGAFGEAFKLIGGASKAVRDEPNDLMLAADVARNSRHPAEATRYLTRVADGFPRDKRAPLAAFTLGRVLMEDLGQPARAADAFKRAQQLAPRGPLASDALAREVDAAQRAGQVDRARQLAARYLEQFPNGPQAQRLRKL